MKKAKNLCLASTVCYGALTIFSSLNNAAFALSFTPSSYTPIPAPSGSYPDSGGTELTDGNIPTDNWNDDNAPYSGWQNVDPVITFNFSESINLDTLNLSFSDSNGLGGVTPPESIEISMGGTTVNRTVTDPADGSPVTEAFSGLGLTGTSLDLTINQSDEWTMISEVSFEGTSAVAVPFEPSANLGILALGGIWGLSRLAKMKKAKNNIQLELK